MSERRNLAVASLIALSLGGAGAASAQEIKLTLADQNSPTAWGPSHALQPWVKQVEEATKGRVKIEVYPSQTLIKGVDMWKGIRSGIADIGWCVQGYWPEQTPLSDVMSLPFLPISSAEKGSEAMWKLYEKFPSVQKEFNEIQPLVLYTSSPNLLVSKKQVRTLEDFKGLKVRVLGGPPTEMAKALGAVPTLIPMPDVYQSLDKGVVDGAAAPWEAVQGFRLYEVAKNYTIAPFYVAYLGMRQQAEMAVPAQGGSRRHHERERAPRRQILGQEFLRYRRGRRDRACESRQLRAQPLPSASRSACALDQARRRADLGGVDQEDGRQRPQGRARHPQQRARFAQELGPSPHTRHRARR